MRHLVVLILVWGCGTSEPQGDPALFPADYRATYQEMRGCRLSLEHSATMRILVSADAVDAYQRTTPFPVGSIVLKEEFAQSDVTCSGPIERYTVMRKLPAGAFTDMLDWEWQDVDEDLHVQNTTTISSCVRCHAVCGKSPQGYDGTCAEP